MNRDTDPRITAYVLGELSPAEREAFEKEKLHDGDVRAEVESLRALLGPLQAHYAAEDAAGAGLTPAQRARVERAVPARDRAWLVPFLAAATLVVAAGFAVWAAGERTVVVESVEARAVPEAELAELDEVTNGVPGDLFELVREGQGGGDGFNALNDPTLNNPGTIALRFSGSVDGDYRGRVENLFVVEERSTEAYDRVVGNPLRRTADRAVSTFSVDVDTASYANVRRFLRGGTLPPPDAVRLEEMVNYFSYDYAPPRAGAHPFRAHVEVAGCPWSTKRRLVRIGLRGRAVPVRERPRTNLVFLLDVSGSMANANKLPLVKRSLELLLEQLREEDRVAIVVYAGASGLVLDSTAASEKAAIRAALGRLDAGGSTNGGAGIELAYEVARKHFVDGGVNRVVLCTDGDFNVGVTDRGQLTRLIEDKAKSGVFLSVLGYGMGNLKDATMEELSNRGNGSYAYVDTLNEARKVLVEQLGGTLVTIAKDVKVQVFFNPKTVAAWRLVGYENRLLAAEDFNDDTKDAGEIGAGHAVTALYEVVPAAARSGTAMSSKVDDNPYVEEARPSARADAGALLMLRLRYKQPDGERSTLMEEEVEDRGGSFDAATGDFRWAASVAGFGMLLRRSQHAPDLTWDGVLEIAQGAVGHDPHGYRQECLDLVRKARALAK